jgi:hypothetical protein
MFGGVYWRWVCCERTIASTSWDVSLSSLWSWGLNPCSTGHLYVSRYAWRSSSYDLILMGTNRMGVNAVGGVDSAMVGRLALSWRVIFVVQPSSTIFTRQSLFWGSRHPLRMVVPLRVTSQLCRWKNTSHPASHRAATKRRLLVRPGRWWASPALGGSDWRRRSTVLVDFILALLGWMTVIWTSVVIALLARALGGSSNTEAVVSMSAVASKFVGLVQPDEKLIALANCELTTTVNFVFAGLTHQVGGLG